MKILNLFLLIFTFFLTVNVSAKTEYDTRDSIVKIYTQVVNPYYSDPWTMDSARFQTGSGCIISGNRILTNAHVIANNTLIQVRRYGEANRYTAKVLHVSHEVDLGILTVESPEFFKGTQPLQIGSLPKTQEEVFVYGFPKGGDTLSITKGVISRIEHEPYAHSNLSFLAAQIDAPINPGNSGGPAINNNGVIVGIIMQALTRSQNIGYMVPPPVIKHFIKDIEKDNYHGFPSLGVRVQNIENEGLKKKYGLEGDQTGVLVIKVIPGSVAEGKIMEKDVLLSVEDKEISGNGTVEFRHKARTHYSYYIQNKQINDRLNLKILRDGKQMNISLVLSKPIQETHLVKFQHDVLPSYFIYGGLVFSTLTINYLNEWGRNWLNKAPSELITIAKSNLKTKEDEEIVILVKILASEVNLGYHGNKNLVVKKVNGKEIRNIRDLVNIVESASSDFVTFEVSSGREIVLDRELVENMNNKILKIYRINSDRSKDLKN